MSIPTQPTKTTLVSEGLKKASYPSPPSALQTRGEDFWLDEVKQDIFYIDPKWKSMMVVSYGVTTKGVSRYANPSDYGTDLSVTILNGEHTGTSTAASASTLTLAATEDFAEDFVQGKLLLVTSGTGLGSCSQISGWNNSTKVATVTPNFTTTPDGNETYMIVDIHYPLTQEMITRRDRLPYPHDKRVPTHYFPIGQGSADDDETGEFQLYPTPDALYGIQLRYGINLLLVDITSNLMKTLFRRWRHIFVQGVLYKALQNDRDARWEREYNIYKNMLQELKVREVYGMQLSELQAVVVE